MHERYMQFPGQHCTLFVRGGMREAVILAMRDDMALVEYHMPPKGRQKATTTALRYLSTLPALRTHPGTTTRYHDVPTMWLEEMVQYDIEWLARTARTSKEPIPSARALLHQRYREQYDKSSDAYLWTLSEQEITRRIEARIERLRQAARNC